MSPSLSVTYYDPESEPVPEPEPEPIPEPTPDPPKRKGRPPGTANKAKAKRKRNIPWYRLVRTFVWWAVAVASGWTLYLGVLGWVGQSVAYLALSVYLIVAAFLLDRDGKKMRNQ